MKILVIHATAGAGHKKAAEAIYNGLLRHSTHRVRIVDSLDYTNSFLRNSYPQFYIFLVTRMPTLWGVFFWFLDIPFLQPLVRVLRRCYNAFNTQAMEKFLKEERFDCIITTHFMSAEVCGFLKRTGQIHAKIVCVVTDFDVHHIWINKGTDIYTCACDITKEKIVKLGISPERVFVTGIPTDEKFAEPVTSIDIRKKLELDTQLFTVLLATGSFGMGPIEQLIDMLKGYQLLVVCGNNKTLYEHLKSKSNERIHILGLVNNMYELMSAADVMVTKPGGLSISEALVKKLPMIFFSAIPGQEIGNINVLKKYQAASDQGSLMSIVQKIDDLSSSAHNYDSLRKKLEPLSKPNAVKDIIALL